MARREAKARTRANMERASRIAAKVKEALETLRPQQVEETHPPANRPADMSPSSANASAASPARSVKSVRIDLTGDVDGAASSIASVRAVSYQSSPEVSSNAVSDPSSPVSPSAVSDPSSPVSSSAVSDPSSPVSSSAVSGPSRAEQCPEVCCAVY